MKDCMIDLETLGRKPGCTILSIGAVMFDPRMPGYGDKFYANIDTNSCRAAGLEEEAETVAWWTGQSPAAKAGLMVDQRPLQNVLYDFIAWFERNAALNVWCQGLTFDVPILSEAFSRIGVVAPWKYYNTRDTRTLYDVCGFDPQIIERQGVFHNAVDDALHQIRCVQTAMGVRAAVMKDRETPAQLVRPGACAHGVMVNQGYLCHVCMGVPAF